MDPDARLETASATTLASEEQMHDRLESEAAGPLKSDLEAFLRCDPPPDAGPGWLLRAIRQTRHDLIHRLHAQGVRMDESCIWMFLYVTVVLEDKSLLDLIPLLFGELALDEGLSSRVANLALCNADLALRLLPYFGTALFNQRNAKKVSLEACPALDGCGMRFDDPRVVATIIGRIWHVCGKARVDGARFLIARCPETVPILKLRGLYWSHLAREDEFPADLALARALTSPWHDVFKVVDGAVDVYSKVYVLAATGRMRVLEISEQEREEARRIHDITWNTALRDACAL